MCRGNLAFADCQELLKTSVYKMMGHLRVVLRMWQRCKHRTGLMGQNLTRGKPSLLTDVDDVVENLMSDND